MSTDRRTAEDWGRVAMAIRGWTWMPRMYDGGRRQTILAVARSGAISAVFPTRPGTKSERWPDPDDPATAGCLLELAGAPHRLLPTVEAWLSGKPVEGITSLGRAVIVDVRDQWGRWPGGAG